MSKLICLHHPKYTGKDSPVLSCKTCCGIFIGQIKEENLKADSDPIAPVVDREQKRRDIIKRRAAASAEAGKGQMGFSPDLI
jgi:hypothetical protein